MKQLLTKSHLTSQNVSLSCRHQTERNGKQFPTVLTLQEIYLCQSSKHFQYLFFFYEAQEPSLNLCRIIVDVSSSRTHTHTHTHTQNHTNTHTQNHTHTHIHTHSHSHSHTLTHTLTHTHSHTLTHTHTFTHTHSHTLTHSHTNTRSLALNVRMLFKP